MQNKKLITTLLFAILSTFMITACSDNSNNIVNNGGGSALPEPEQELEPVKEFYSRIFKNVDTAHNYYTYSYSQYAVLQDGSLYAWGDNSIGQLGLELTDKYVEQKNKMKIDIPEKVNRLWWPTEYENSERHLTFAITEEGSLYAWGSNSNGQLGVGDEVDKNTPTKVDFSGKIKELRNSYDRSGNFSIYAILEEGSLYAWGDNRYGQLGVGDNISRNTPIKVNLPGKIKELINIGHSVYVILEDGSLYAWGYNRGWLGVGHNINENIPTKIEILSGKVKELRYIGSSGYAVLEDGSLYSWGSNNSGQLGLGDGYARMGPEKVNLPGKIKELKIVGGYESSILTILEDGSLYVWGDNGFGQLGVGDNIDKNAPTKVNLPGKVKELIINDDSSYVILEDGSLYAWGYNGFGQLGVGDEVNKNAPTKVNLPGKIKELILDGNTSYAILEDSSLYGWGDNQYRQIYDVLGGIAQYYTTPREIYMKHNISIKAKELKISGDYSYHAILEDGSLYAWGYNEYGQLGLGNGKNRVTPSRVGIYDSIVNQVWIRLVEKTIGGKIIKMYSCYATTEDGSLYTWGYNEYGQLGIGSGVINITEPILFTTIPGTIKQIESSEKDTYFLTNDGLLYGAGLQYSNYPEPVKFKNK